MHLNLEHYIYSRSKGSINSHTANREGICLFQKWIESFTTQFTFSLFFFFASQWFLLYLLPPLAPPSQLETQLKMREMKWHWGPSSRGTIPTCLPPSWLMWCYQLVCLQLVLLHSLSFANLCSHEQSSALLQFKQLFSFHNHSSSDCDYVGILSYPKMMSWKDNIDCCSWDWPRSQHPYQHYQH